ncbi:phosphoheptose isomerase [Candidatus Poribacteria bacterium]|nr:phosphoheptose isomerase [Candidatus Poribacteria bacterium]
MTLLSEKVIRSSLSEARKLLTMFIEHPDTIRKLTKIASTIQLVFEKRGRVFVCGNGGSMCDAMHFAEEWTGKFRKERAPMPVIALGDPSHLTCVANDFGFESVFSRSIQALGHTGDLLIAISTSGNSENVIQAAQVAKLQSMTVFGMLGKDGGKLKSECDQYLIAPGSTSDRIQEIHMLAFHILIEAVEQTMFPI